MLDIGSFNLFFISIFWLNILKILLNISIRIFDIDEFDVLSISIFLAHGGFRCSIFSFWSFLFFWKHRFISNCLILIFSIWFIHIVIFVENIDQSLVIDVFDISSISIFLAHGGFQYYVLSFFFLEVSICECLIFPLFWTFWGFEDFIEDIDEFYVLSVSIFLTRGFHFSVFCLEFLIVFFFLDNIDIWMFSIDIFEILSISNYQYFDFYGFFRFS